ncbi:MAG: carboxypeptidase-like regulatory domain-containing protein, partial [Candidatus Altarchaeum sp.]|nr:carboxypeptidase-like regulatory domain-containing protein [Candidatus Altarchaeum sp.]
MLKGKMLKNLRAITLLAILVGVFINMFIIGMTSAEIVKINGTIKDFYGPIGDAEIKIYDALGSNCQSNNCPSADVLSLQPIKTNASGNFQILINVSYEKTYNLTVKKENYENTTKQLTLSNNSQNLSIEIDIRGIAKVEGFIVDAESGMTVKNARVNILDKGYRTGEEGYFIFQKVSAETHTITIEHDDYETQSFVYDIQSGKNFKTIKISKEHTTKDYA